MFELLNNDSNSYKYHSSGICSSEDPTITNFIQWNNISLKKISNLKIQSKRMKILRFIYSQVNKWKEKICLNSRKLTLCFMISYSTEVNIIVIKGLWKLLNFIEIMN